MDHGEAGVNKLRKLREAFVDCPNIAGLNGVPFASQSLIAVGYPLFFLNLVDNQWFLDLNVSKPDL